MGYDDWHHAVMGVGLLTDRGPSCVLARPRIRPVSRRRTVGSGGRPLTHGSGGSARCSVKFDG
jgi:hypothetical protein